MLEGWILRMEREWVGGWVVSASEGQTGGYQQQVCLVSQTDFGWWVGYFWEDIGVELLFLQFLSAFHWDLGVEDYSPC